MQIDNIVVLTGAGISAESGLATFRASDGLWCGHKVEEVATPEGFARNPQLVYDFYNARRRQLHEVAPNAAHVALARFAQRWHGSLLLITQNVDDLHDRAHQDRPAAAGFSLLHMHGELRKARCMDTGHVLEWWDDMDSESISPVSGRAGALRPHIVWFGEMPLEMGVIDAALRRCDLFISIGTSGNVYPAAGFVAQASAAGAHTVELNLEPSLGQSMFAEKIYGAATDIVPKYLESL
jgi:NAD-dependent deacetylase